MRVETADDVDVGFAVESAFCEANGHTCRNAHRTQHKHLSRSIIVAETLLKVKEYPLNGVLPLRGRLREWVGIFDIVPQIGRDRGGFIVRCFRILRDSSCQFTDTRRKVFRELQVPVCPLGITCSGLFQLLYRWIVQ